MKKETPTCVITSINPPTEGVKKLVSLFPNSAVIVIGDSKTPNEYVHELGIDFISLKTQNRMPYSFCKVAPVNHYSRKNIGYLKAMRNGSSVIYDTDDDNIPNSNWTVREQECNTRFPTTNGWCNAYKFFSNAHIWPRGFPLHLIRTHSKGFRTFKEVVANSPIQQGLADGNPDVDAIYRLTTVTPVNFTKKLSVSLAPKTWCPFNSQSTWWWPIAYPLMYLPVTVNFRMTDIWRSFIAQRCLWADKLVVTYHSPSEVTQKRNPHNLIHDLENEMPGYKHNEEIRSILNDLCLQPNHMMHNMKTCYTALVKHGIVDGKELMFLEAWMTDIVELKLLKWIP